MRIRTNQSNINAAADALCAAYRDISIADTYRELVTRRYPETARLDATTQEDGGCE